MISFLLIAAFVCFVVVAVRDRSVLAGGLACWVATGIPELLN